MNSKWRGTPLCPYLKRCFPNNNNNNNHNNHDDHSMTCRPSAAGKNTVFYGKLRVQEDAKTFFLLLDGGAKSGRQRGRPRLLQQRGLLSSEAAEDEAAERLYRFFARASCLQTMQVCYTTKKPCFDWIFLLV